MSAKLLTDAELFGEHWIAPTEEERAKYPAFSDELFLCATRFTHWASLAQLVAALDRAGYWGDGSFTPAQKEAHARRKLEGLKAGDARMDVSDEIKSLGAIG